MKYVEAAQLAPDDGAARQARDASKGKVVASRLDRALELRKSDLNGAIAGTTSALELSPLDSRGQAQLEELETERAQTISQLNELLQATGHDKYLTHLTDWACQLASRLGGGPRLCTQGLVRRKVWVNPADAFAESAKAAQTLARELVQCCSSEFEVSEDHPNILLEVASRLDVGETVGTAVAVRSTRRLGTRETVNPKYLEAQRAYQDAIRSADYQKAHCTMDSNNCLLQAGFADWATASALKTLNETPPTISLPIREAYSYTRVPIASWSHMTEELRVQTDFGQGESRPLDSKRSRTSYLLLFAA